MTTFALKNLRRLFDKYAVAPTEHDSLVQSTYDEDFIQILWPSQKTQTLLFSEMNSTSWDASMEAIGYISTAAMTLLVHGYAIYICSAVHDYQGLIIQNHNV